jgi:hypothetical protein
MIRTPIPYLNISFQKVKNFFSSIENKRLDKLEEIQIVHLAVGGFEIAARKINSLAHFRFLLFAPRP